MKYPTEEAIDIKLAELAGEPIHNWKLDRQLLGFWSCKHCGGRHGGKYKPKNCKLRAHSLDLLWAYADEKNLRVEVMSNEVCAMGLARRIDKIADVASSAKARYRDYPSRAEARRVALGNAICIKLEWEARE